MVGSAQVETPPTAAAEVVTDDEIVDTPTSDTPVIIINGHTISLPAPSNTEKHYYQIEEVIEFSLRYGKTPVIEAIDKWAALMRNKHNLGSSTKLYGPKKAQLAKYFPSKKTQTITKNVVQHLLAGMEKGTPDWLAKVAIIAGGAPSENTSVKGMKNCPTREEIFAMADYRPQTERLEATNLTVNTEEGATRSSSQITPDASILSSAGSFDDNDVQLTNTCSSNVGIVTISPEVSSSLRGGRWSNTELTYALHLIRLFRERWIPIQDGTTIREFLSAMLRCDPQRISDKFRCNKYGLVIGEEPPFSRDIAVANEMDPDTIETEHSNLRELEGRLIGCENSQPIFGQAATDPIASIMNDQISPFELVSRMSDDQRLSRTVSSDLSLESVGKRMKRDAATKRLPLIASFLYEAYKDATGTSAIFVDGGSASTVEPSPQRNVPMTHSIGSSTTVRSEDMKRNSASGVHGDIVQEEQPQSNDRHDPISSAPDILRNTVHPIVSPTAADVSARSNSKLHDNATQEGQLQSNNIRNTSSTDPDAPNILHNYDELKCVVDNLDWAIRPRPSRNGQAIVEVHKKKQAGEILKYEIMVLTREILMNNPDLDESDKKVKQEVEKYATKLLFYDHGYEQVKYITSRWENQLMNSFLTGENNRPLASKYAGRKALIDQLELKYPGKMRDLFRKAQKQIGLGATFEDLARTMNIIAKEEGLDDFHLNKNRVWHWFSEQGGKLKSPKPKPLLTPELKEQRLKWAIEMLQMLKDGKILVFLDEKWFWTTSLRRKLKELPLAEGENPEDLPEVPKARSRRMATKAMFMGAVATPCPEHEFDGKVFHKRVAQVTEYKKEATYNSNFTDSAELNEQLKGEGWHELVKDGMTLRELRAALAEHYNLDDSISNRIVLRHQIRWLDDDGKKHKATFHADNEFHVPSLEHLKAFHDYSLRVKYVQGDKRVVDVTCDSKFMLETMHEVGEAIRKKYHWIAEETPIFLVLDNAGGHGTNEAIEEYVTFLKEEYNVHCHHQCPRSPETNMLDLGVWMALQNVVERLHFRQRHEVNALCRTVDLAWEALNPVKLENVFRRLEKVLELIIEDKGDNTLVESNRGKFFREPSDETENLALGEEETEAHNALYDAELPEDDDPPTTGFVVNTGEDSDEFDDDNDGAVSGGDTDLVVSNTNAKDKPVGKQKQGKRRCDECTKSGNGKRRGWINHRCCRNMCKSCCDQVIDDGRICTEHKKGQQPSTGKAQSPLLIFPFNAEEHQFCTAASELNELKLARDSFEDDGGNALQVENVQASHASRTCITVRKNDIDRLSPGVWFNDVLVDLWMKWISGAPNNSATDVQIFTTFFMTTLAKDGPEGVRNWTANKNIDIFRKKLIFVPVNADLHWSLCVVVNPGSIANNLDDEMYGLESYEGSFILFLDPLLLHNEHLYASKIRDWLNSEWVRLNKDNASPNPFNDRSMPLLTPRIPYQNNNSDCGVFVCRYAYNLFQMRHTCFTQSDMVDQCKALISDNALFQFDNADIARIRKEFRSLIRKLSDMYVKTKRL